jgi:NAD(P)-dependent dehydrogenase (short-subunit alcohol dehydrogenase family)
MMAPGSKVLHGRRVIVGGGTGDIGVAVTAALLDAGADVIVPVRNAAKSALLPASDRLHLVEGFPVDDDGVLQLSQAISALGPVDGAIASIGPWLQSGPLLSVGVDTWNAALDASLTSHLLFARAVIPVLAPRAGYIFINGAAALEPVPGAGATSIAARAQTMLADVLEAENPAIGVHRLMLRSFIATRRRTDPDPRWVTAAEVGQMCCWLLGDLGQLTAGSTITLNMRRHLPER